jgi:hypothetical protein
MQKTTLTKTFSSEVFVSDLEQILDEVIQLAEAAEVGLAIDAERSNLKDRIASGSFYTPADVVEHFWREYFSFHSIANASSLRDHFAEFQFVEPAMGAGIFLFGLLKAAVAIGCALDDLLRINFVGVDINRNALAFVKRCVKQIEKSAGSRFEQLEFRNSNFLQFIPTGSKVSYVGNPPYVRNERASRWKNLYADFMERMLDSNSVEHSISLIVPVSINFSRDYVELRHKIRRTNRAIRIESFDNIPDCLFKAGKPGSENTNKANSQRCSIVFFRNHGQPTFEATSLRRWFRGERSSVLAGEPEYVDFQDYKFDNQFPRPNSRWIMKYLADCGPDPLTIGEITGESRFGFSVAGVARNFIGLRDLDQDDSSAIPLKFPSEKQRLWGLQLLASPIFFEYWRTVGDGFHITKSDILRFPISNKVWRECVVQESRASTYWKKRANCERTKLNSGKLVKSYDFRGQFDYLLDALLENSVEHPAPAFKPNPKQLILLRTA